IDSISSNRAVIAARTSGSWTPASARNTTEPVAPAPLPPKASSRISVPRRLSTSGSSSSVRVSVPRARTTDPAAITTRVQAMTTTQRRRWHHVPRRANTGVLPAGTRSGGGRRAPGAADDVTRGPGRADSGALGALVAGHVLGQLVDGVDPALDAAGHVGGAAHQVRGHRHAEDLQGAGKQQRGAVVGRVERDRRA